jgi:hypothetical protein
MRLMIQQHPSRSAAACGVFFAVGLFGAAGDGGYSTTREVIATVALALAIPFMCYLGRILRGTEAPSNWMVDTAVAAGITGIVLKLASGVPEVAQHQAHLGSSSEANQALARLAAATTVASLIPFALFCVATGAVILRTKVLPRWVGIGAAVTAATLAVNGAVLGANFVPAMLVFLLWTLLTSLHLLRASWRRPSTTMRFRATAQADPVAPPPGR